MLVHVNGAPGVGKSTVVHVHGASPEETVAEVEGLLPARGVSG